MVSPRLRAITPQAAAPTRLTRTQRIRFIGLMYGSASGCSKPRRLAAPEVNGSCLRQVRMTPPGIDPPSWRPDAAAALPPIPVRRFGSHGAKNPSPRWSSPPSFRGKVAMVTGGATGLGRSVALEFGRLGCSVAFCFVDLPGRDVRETALLTETAISSMGVGVFADCCDVRDRAQVERFVAAVKAKFETIHFLVNNAGMANDGAHWRLDPGRVGRGDRHQPHRRVQLHQRRRPGVPGPAIRKDRERELAPGRPPRLRRGQLRRQQGRAGGA